MPETLDAQRSGELPEYSLKQPQGWLWAERWPAILEMAKQDRQAAWIMVTRNFVFLPGLLVDDLICGRIPHVGIIVNDDDEDVLNFEWGGPLGTLQDYYKPHYTDFEIRQDISQLLPGGTSNKYRGILPQLRPSA